MKKPKPEEQEGMPQHQHCPPATKNSRTYLIGTTGTALCATLIPVLVAAVPFSAGDEHMNKKPHHMAKQALAKPSEQSLPQHFAHTRCSYLNVRVNN
jgi:hypothetical protein